MEATATLNKICQEVGVCEAREGEAHSPKLVGGNEMIAEEIEQIAKRTAEEVVARIREGDHDTLLLHSVPYTEGSPGIVVNEALAEATPCRCIEYRPGKKLCFSRGCVGALSDPQEKLYCHPEEKLESPGLEKRMEHWMESVDICKAEIAKIPPGERLKPWLGCMSRELSARGVEV